MKTTSYFSVVYSYYQYNDGSANDGDRSGEVRLETPHEAVELAAAINAAAARHRRVPAAVDGASQDEEISEETEWNDRELVNRYVAGCCGGYFHSAEPQFVTVSRKPLVSNAALLTVVSKA